MKLYKSIVMMGLTTFIKLALALLVTSYLARGLGVELFGELMLYLAIATLAALPINFGINTYIMKEMPRRSSRGTFITSSFSFKAISSSLYFLFIFILMYIIDFDINTLAFLLLFASILVESCTSYFLTCLRSCGQFKLDLKFSTFSSIVYLVAIYGVLIYSKSLAIVALSFFISRLICLFLVMKLSSSYLSNFGFIYNKKLILWFYRSRFFALDSIFSSVHGNMDSIILNNKLGVSAVGFYQSGLKLYLTALQVAAVFSNVFLPRASRAYGTLTFKKEVLLLQISFLILSLIVFIIFSSLSEFIVSIIYGPNFSKLILLMPYFGLLAAQRFIIASLGIVLTSAGAQAFRTKCNAINLFIIIISSFLFLPITSIQDWFELLLITNLLLFLMYYFWVLYNGFFSLRVFAFQLLLIAYIIGDLNQVG